MQKMLQDWFIRIQIRYGRSRHKCKIVKNSLVLTIFLSVIFASLASLLEIGGNIVGAINGIKSENSPSNILLRSFWLSWVLNYAAYIIVAMYNHQVHVNNLVKYKVRRSLPKLKDTLFAFSIVVIISSLCVLLVFNSINIEQVNTWTLCIYILVMLLFVSSLINMVEIYKQTIEESEYKSYIIKLIKIY